MRVTWPGNGCPGISATRTIAVTPGLTPTAASWRHEKLDAHDVAVRYREHKGAARRIGLDQAADIDVALGNDAVERSDDPLIVFRHRIGTPKGRGPS
jgi:hypothetical protein